MIETNRYAEQYTNQRGNLFPFRFPVRSWVPVTENKICVVFGLFLLMGIVQKLTVRSYFSKKRVLSTPGFSDVIGRERFELIRRFLHLFDSNRLPGASETIHNLSYHISSQPKIYIIIFTKAEHRT